MNSAYLDNYFQNPNTFKTVKKPVQGTEAAILVADRAKRVMSEGFSKVAEKSGSSFTTDKHHAIAAIHWDGHVDIHTAKKFIQLAFEAIEFHGYKKLVLDQTNLIVFETEARVWVKEVLRHKAQRLDTKLKKLASIRPKSPIGSVYCNFAGDILKEELPELKMKRFESFDEAIDWLS